MSPRDSPAYAQRVTAPVALPAWARGRPAAVTLLCFAEPQAAGHLIPLRVCEAAGQDQAAFPPGLPLTHRAPISASDIISNWVYTERP